jgi:hypothetical protein
MEDGSDISILLSQIYRGLTVQLRRFRNGDRVRMVLYINDLESNFCYKNFFKKFITLVRNKSDHGLGNYIHSGRDIFFRMIVYHGIYIDKSVYKFITLLRNKVSCVVYES